MLAHRHNPSAADTLGRDLTITVTIDRAGRLHFHDLTLDMLPVAVALCPDSADVARRYRAAQRLTRKATDDAH